MKYLKTYEELEELTFDEINKIISKSSIFLYFMTNDIFIAGDSFFFVLDPRGRNYKTDDKFINDLAKFFIKNNIIGEDYLGHISKFDQNKSKKIKGLHCHYKSIEESDQKININELKEFIEKASIMSKAMKYNL